MYLPRKQLTIALAFTLTLSCGSPKFVSVRPSEEGYSMNVNSQAAGDGGIRLLRAAVAYAGAVHAAESRTTSPSSVDVHMSTAAPAPSVEIGTAISLTVDWDCIALYETGSDWTAHGSSYSSALGIMNEAVRENASEEVAARILSGTASREEQIQMAQGIVNRFGIDAWAPSTVEKCS